VACLVAASLLATNVRDMAADARSGRSTLPIVLGKGAAVTVYDILLGVAFGATAIAAALRLLPPTSLIVFMTVALALRMAKLLGQGEGPALLNPAVRGSAMIHARFGLLLALG